MKARGSTTPSRRRSSMNAQPSVTIYPTPMHPHPGQNVTSLLLGTPTLGTVRVEWANAIQSLVNPCNWTVARVSPVGYPTHVGQNIIAAQVLRDGIQCMLLVEDDNIVPADLYFRLDRYLLTKRPGDPTRPQFPIVSGLYFQKASFTPLLGPEPLVYRGSGTRAWYPRSTHNPDGWVPGTRLRVDGFPTGCVLIHRKILEAYATEPDTVWETIPGVSHPVPRIFDQPKGVHIDEAGAPHAFGGTSDLYFAAEVMRRKLLAKAGWPELQRSPHPYIIDSTIRVGHIDRLTGKIYPEAWPQAPPAKTRAA